MASGPRSRPRGDCEVVAECFGELLWRVKSEETTVGPSHLAVRRNITGEHPQPISLGFYDGQSKALRLRSHHQGIGVRIGKRQFGIVQVGEES